MLTQLVNKYESATMFISGILYKGGDNVHVTLDGKYIIVIHIKYDGALKEYYFYSALGKREKLIIAEQSDGYMTVPYQEMSLATFIALNMLHP